MNQTNRKRIALVGCLLLLLIGISGCFTRPDPVEVVPTEQPDPLEPVVVPTTPPPLPSDDGWDPVVTDDGGVMPVITTPPSTASSAPTQAPTQAPTASPSPTPRPTEDTTLRSGSEGENVRRLQQRLKDLGYYTGSVDGEFGQGTESAVREFQRAHGLTADGVAGQQTLSTLNSSSAKSKPKPTADPAYATSRPTPKSYTPSTPGVYGYLELGSGGTAVRNLQQRLKELGYYSGAVNGNYQESTEAAVRAFQERNGEWVDGKAGPDTQQALYSSNALPAARGGTVPSTGYRTLSAGTDGDDVKSLQEKLTEMGFYTGRATGEYDDATTVAVTAFQQTNGLEPSGVAGAGTQVRLYSTLALYATESAGEIAPPSLETLEMGSTGDDVYRLQERLYDLGYYTDRIDGSFDEDVRDAVRAFQRGNGITADGKAGKNTLTKIYSESAKPAADVDDAYATLREGDTGERVRALQGLLKTYGYFTDDVDGRYREATVSAVYRLQAQNGLIADGIAGPGTQQLLYLGTPETARADAPAQASGATSAPAYAALRQGTESPDVTMMQQFLEELGYAINDESGTFGASTLLAVQAFQEMNDMTPTGVADSAMLALLYSGLGVPSASFGAYVPETPDRDTMREGDIGQDVFTMQERLTALGYLADGPTGTYDGTTTAAVRLFQQRNGLSADGVAGRETVSAMYATGVIPAAEVNEAAQGYIEVNNTARELSEQSATGAIQASLAGGGIAARYDGTLYFAGKDGKLYRQRGSGTERLLYDGKASFIHASGSGVTFLSGNRVLRVPLDGGKAQTLASGSNMQKLAVVYNTLYYLDAGRLYKQPVAGEKTVLAEDVGDFTIDVFQNAAYVSGPSGIRSVGLNASGEEQIMSSDARDVQVVDAIVFFRTDGGIWRMQEGVPVQIMAGSYDWMAVYRDKLYYITDGTLHRADTDGKNTEIFHDGQVAEVSFASGNVYVTERKGGPVAAVIPVDSE